MFAVCVYRRYGLLVPVVLFVVALLMELAVDHSQGKGYYGSHYWTIGLSVFLTGILLGVAAYQVDDTNTYKQDGYSLLDGDLELGNLSLFVTEPQDSDMFFYVPLNWCAIALTGLGVVLMFMELVPST